jgi:hypothetical protein
VQDGVFDSGLAAILDVLDYANALADEVPGVHRHLPAR